MKESYSVRLTKEELVFSAAHFITFNGNICERLHGHNYGVEASISGNLDENCYVIDFIALRDTLKEIVTELDHHVLLPTQHKQISVNQKESEIVARFEDRRWVFPAEDCVLLDIENTTAELLAKHIGEELVAKLREKYSIEVESLQIGVDENNGQWGYWNIATTTTS